MTVHINLTPHEISFDPDVITLGQYSRFYDQYGRDIDKELAALESDDEHGADALLDKEAAAWFEFHTGYPLGNEHAEPFLLRYRLLRGLINTTPDDIYPVQFEWNGEQWEIQSPVVNAASPMVFSEVTNSKYAMQLVRDAGAGKWTALLYLSTVFYRKVGEAYSDELTQDGSARLTLLSDMPLSHAAAVGFFLNDCVTTWSETFPYSELAGSEKVT